MANRSEISILPFIPRPYGEGVRAWGLSTRQPSPGGAEEDAADDE